MRDPKFGWATIWITPLAISYLCLTAVKSWSVKLRARLKPKPSKEIQRLQELAGIRKKK